jgi:hypothetical protein
MALAGFWHYPFEEEAAMKKLLILSVVRFAALAVPVALMYFLH